MANRVRSWRPKGSVPRVGGGPPPPAAGRVRRRGSRRPVAGRRSGRSKRARPVAVEENAAEPTVLRTQLANLAPVVSDVRRPVGPVVRIPPVAQRVVEMKLDPAPMAGLRELADSVAAKGCSRALVFGERRV